MRLLFLCPTSTTRVHFDKVMQSLVRLIIIKATESGKIKTYGELPEIKIITTEDINEIDYVRNLLHKYKMNMRSIYHDYKSDFSELISKADAIVIENSLESFNLGYAISIAEKQRKPVLILSKWEPGTDDNFLYSHREKYNGNHLIQVAKYQKYTILPTIISFIKDASKHILSKKINLFITDDEKSHILKQAKHMSISNSEFIRKLVDDDIIRTSNPS